ncbi:MULTISPECIES: MBL fold metallo-hydrolase [unclassified Butyrivibrio]|uniref:MBL fold metallo-hydrolase n=1 Tax=unclassified Butyrivibrio TaxID=2639466 RepID=UPI0003FFE1A1|nr:MULTISPECIES: MBL fold metallo-hydrolase [unclassified Butyrivibrio]SEK29204.1 Glyoxylase, beta-lactamase superfamily II [Butyrivibrio sp. ob235]
MSNKEIGTAAVGSMCLGMVQTNCYFVYKEDGKDHSENAPVTDENDLTPVVFFDPADLGKLIYEKLKNHGFKVDAIYLTHAHFDHIGGVDELRKLSGAKVFIYEKEKRLCEDPDYNLSSQFGENLTVKPDKYLCDGDECEAAGLRFKLIATPGHTEGSCCYYFEEDHILISGDTLFEGSVGRTDFPGGSMSTLVRSCHERLWGLPDDTEVFPGHGPSTTIGYEKMNNMYL